LWRLYKGTREAVECQNVPSTNKVGLNLKKNNVFQFTAKVTAFKTFPYHQE